MPKINPDLCFQPLPLLAEHAAAAIDVDTLITQFIETWSKYIKDNSDGFHHSLAARLMFHIGPDATHQDKELLKSYLISILNLLCDRHPIPLTAEDKNYILIELKDPIANCSAGLVNRANMIIIRHNLMDSFPKLFFSMSQNLVENLARGTTSFIHSYNHVFTLAHQLFPHIRIPNPHDVHLFEQQLNPQEIKRQLRALFASEFGDFRVVHSLLAEVKKQLTHLKYRHKLNGESYTLGAVKSFGEYFNAVFDISIEHLEYIIADEESSYIIDLNWPRIIRTLVDQLYEKHFLEESCPGERQFFDSFLANDMTQTIQLAEVIFQGDDTRLLDFIKLGSPENKEAQFLLLDYMYPRLDATQQLRLSIKLISHFAEFYRPRVTQLNTQYQFLEQLNEPAVLANYFENTQLQQSCLPLISCMSEVSQANILKNRAFGINSLVTHIAANHLELLPQLLDLLEKLPEQEVRDILLHKPNLAFASLCVKSRATYLNRVWSLYTTKNCITEDLFRVVDGAGNHLMMDVIHYMPEQLSPFLSIFFQHIHANLIKLLVHKNANHMSCLSMALRQPSITQQMIHLISQIPTPALNLLITQRCESERNTLLFCLKNCPDQFASLNQLLRLLDAEQQYVLLMQTDLQKNNFLHLASQLSSKTFETLFSTVLAHGVDKTFKILLQANAQGHDIFKHTLLNASDKFAFIFKNLIQAVSKQIVIDLLFSSPAQFSSYLNLAIAQAPTSIAPLLMQLELLDTSQQKIAVLNQKNAEGKGFLEYAIDFPRSFEQIFQFYLTKVSQFIHKTQLYSFLYENCFSNSDKIRKFILFVANQDLDSNSNIADIFKFFVAQVAKTPTKVEELVELCCQLIDENNSNLMDTLFLALDQLEQHSPAHHCKALLASFEKFPQHTNALLPHFGTCLGYSMMTNSETARPFLDYAKNMNSEQFCTLFSTYPKLLIKSAKGAYFQEFFEFCHQHFDESTFDTVLNQFDSENQENLLMSSFNCETSNNLELILTLPEPALLKQLMLVLGESECAFTNILLDSSPHTQLLVERVLQLSQASQLHLFSHYPNTINFVLQRQSEACDHLLNLIIEKDFFNIERFNFENLQNSLQFPPTLFQRLLSKLSNEHLKDLVFGSSEELLFCNLFDKARDYSDCVGANILFLLQKFSTLGCDESDMSKQINFDNFWQICQLNLDNKQEILQVFLNLVPNPQDKIELWTSIDKQDKNAFRLCLEARQPISPLIQSLLHTTAEPAVIVEVLQQVSSHEITPLLYSCESSQSENTQHLLSLIEERLTPEQQVDVLSHTNGDYENILSITIDRQPELLPTLCQQILRHPDANLCNNLMIMVDIDHELNDVFKLKDSEVAAFFELFSRLSMETLSGMLFSKERESEHFLDRALLSQKHQFLLLALLRTIPKKIFYDLLSEDTFNYLLHHPAPFIRDFLDLLSLTFRPNIILDRLNRSESIFQTDKPENLLTMLDFIGQFEPAYHAQLLTQFSWDSIFEKDQTFIEHFFAGLPQRHPDFLKLLLEKDALIHAVLSKKTPNVQKTLDMIQTLNESTQKQLFSDFDEARELKYKLTARHAAGLALVLPHIPNLRRTHTSISMFSEAEHSEAKKSKPNGPAPQ